MITVIVSYRLANDKSIIDLRYSCNDIDDAFALIGNLAKHSETEIIEFLIMSDKIETKFNKGDNHNGQQAEI